MKRLSIKLSILLVVLLMVGSSYGSVIISDTDFSAGDWQVLYNDSSTHASGLLNITVTQEDYQTSGNNVMRTDASWSGYDQQSGNIKVVYGNVYTAASYDPSTQGAITELSYSVKHERGPIGYSKFAYFMVEQDGKYYYKHEPGHRDNSADGNWTTFGLTGITASDLWRELPDNNWPGSYQGDPTQTPDFSSSGSPIRFGFIEYNADGGVSTTFSNYFDDFQVEIIPEPTTLLLLGSGFMALSVRRKRC